MARRWQHRLAAGLMGLAAMGIVTAIAWAKMSKAELQQELKDTGLSGDWNYDDIDGAFARAAKLGKPVCVVFR